MVTFNCAVTMINLCEHVWFLFMIPSYCIHPFGCCYGSVLFSLCRMVIFAIPLIKICVITITIEHLNLHYVLGERNSIEKKKHFFFCSKEEEKNLQLNDSIFHSIIFPFGSFLRTFHFVSVFERKEKKKKKK